MTYNPEQFFRGLGSDGLPDEDGVAEFLSALSDVAPTEIAAFLGYLLGRYNGRDAATIVAAVRRLAPPHRISGSLESPTVNIVGTGGGPATFNISTATSFLLAAAGIRVIKTGSTAWRSKSGFMETAMALGCLKDPLTWGQVELIADQAGIAFVPPVLYPSVIRKMAGLLQPNVFRRIGYYINIIGPLLSPVDVDFRFLGASSGARQALLVDAVRRLGDVPTCVAMADNGLDEVSSIGKTNVVRIDANDNCDTITVDPSNLSLADVTIEDLAGTNPIRSAKLLQRILRGEGTRQQAEVVALNGATVLQCLGKHDSIATAFDACMALLSSGRPWAQVAALREAVANV